MNSIQYRERKEKKFRDLIEKTIEELPENPSLPDGLPTLLNIPGRRELPKTKGNPSLLERIVLDNQETYEKYIVFLKKGAYPHTAAEAVGISIHTVRDWGLKGRKDFEAGNDTYYARFYQDVRKATAQCRVAIEQTLATLDPRKWMNQGPGRMFGNEWAERLTAEPSVEGTEPFTDTPIVEEVPQIEGTGVDTMIVKMDALTEQETIAILREVTKERKEIKE